MFIDINNKNIKVTKYNNTEIQGKVLKENELFIIMTAKWNVSGGTMESEEVIPKQDVKGILILS